MAVGDLVARRGPKPKERFTPPATYRKICNVCRKRRLAKFFHKRAASFDGLAFTCKLCVSNYGQARYGEEDQKRDMIARARAWQKDNPERRKEILRKHNLKRVYGITPEHYESMLRKQKGVCGICRGDNGGKRLLVDHDHQSGRVRSLLCVTCNLALGALKDDPELALASARYLRRWVRSRPEI